MKDFSVYFGATALGFVLVGFWFLPNLKVPENQQVIEFCRAFSLFFLSIIILLFGILAKT